MFISLAVGITGWSDCIAMAAISVDSVVIRDVRLFLRSGRRHL